MNTSAQKSQKEHARVVPFVPPGKERDRDKAASKRHGLGRLVKIVMLAVAGLVLVALLGLTGYLVYRNALRKQLLASVRKVDAMLSLDRPLAYQEAEKALNALDRKMPGEFSVTLRRAEVAAFRWGRFGSSRREGTLAKRLTAALVARAPDAERVQALAALMALYSGDRDRAAVLAERGLVHHPRSARLSYVLGMARLRNGELEAAEATLRLAVSYDSKYLPALYHLAVVDRLRGRLDLASGYLGQVLKISPGHEGALVEKTLIRFLRTGSIEEAALDRAAQQAGSVPEYRARFLLVKALSDRRLGRLDAAAKSLAEAARIRPQEPEYALALVDMEVGRNVEAAGRVLLPKWRILRQYPDAAVVTARLDLARGRPYEALRRLEELRRAGLSDDRLAVAQALDIRGMILAAQWAKVEGKCRYWAKVGWKSSDPRFKACLDFAWTVRSRKLMRYFLRHVHGGQLRKAVLSGVRNLANHRPWKAARLLSGCSGDVLRFTGTFAVHALLEAGRPHSAADLALQVVKVRGGDIWSRLLLAEAAHAAGYDRKALAELRKIDKVLSPQSPYARFLEGRILANLGDRGQTDRLIQSLSRRDDGRVWADWLSALWAMTRKKWRRASRKMARVVRAEPGLWLSWLELGIARFRDEDHRGARKAFSEAASRGDRAVALSVLMKEELRAGLIPDALRSGLAAAKLFRRRGATAKASIVYARLADAMSRQDGYNRRRVKRMFRRAIEMRHVPSESALLYAEFLRRRGRPEDALSWYERAVEANPQSRDALYRRLWCMVHLQVSAGRLRHAVDAFLAVEGRGARARRARHWLKRALAFDARARKGNGTGSKPRYRSRKSRRGGSRRR